mgnify:CR=1 FL=1
MSVFVEESVVYHGAECSINFRKRLAKVGLQRQLNKPSESSYVYQHLIFHGYTQLNETNCELAALRVAGILRSGVHDSFISTIDTYTTGADIHGAS